MPVQVLAVDRPQAPPLTLSDRFRHDVAYFMSAPGEAGTPELAAGEYWIPRERAQAWFDEGVIELVSPLDSEAKAEVELSEEHESWLEWMLEHGVERIRLQ